MVGVCNNVFFGRGLAVVLLLRSLGSPNWMINQDLCGGCRAVSLRSTGLDITRGEDIDNARCALVVGRNSYDADPIEWIELKNLKKRGGQIVVIDPKRIPTVGIADLWLRPKPGTDAAIGLAMINVMIEDGLYDKDFVARATHGFDRLAERAREFPPERAAMLSGVPAADIVAATRLYAHGPSTFVSGHGIDAFSAGVQTFRAFHCLVGISGNVDRLGGNRRSKKPKGFLDNLNLVHDPKLRLPLRDRAADDRRGQISVMGRPARLADRLPQSGSNRRHPHRQALSAARHVSQRRQYRGDLSEHAEDRGTRCARSIF